MLPEIPLETNLHLVADTKNTHETITPSADIPEEARARLKELLEKKCTNIISQSTTDISRTNVLELDIPTEGLPIASKPYSVPLKCMEFMDQEIKQLEETGIISRSMSDWASPILVALKKDERPVPTKPNSSTSKPTKPMKEFSLRLCINYRKLNSHIVTARQIKSEGSIGKVIVNYPLPTINHLLTRFKRGKYFSTIDLRSGYYHVRLSKEATEKTAFVINKGKWIFHSLPFGINIGPSAFSYVLVKVLSSCQEFNLNYLDDVIVFSRI